MMRVSPQLVYTFGTVALFSLALGAQTPRPSSGQYVPKQSDRPSPVEGDEPGFESIFDGRTLTSWDGDLKYWRVEEGSLV